MPFVTAIPVAITPTIIFIIIIIFTLDGAPSSVYITRHRDSRARQIEGGCRGEGLEKGYGALLRSTTVNKRRIDRISERIAHKCMQHLSFYYRCYAINHRATADSIITVLFPNPCTLSGNHRCKCKNVQSEIKSFVNVE